MDITADKVKDLRERTGIGMMECKSALTESGGDMEKAIEILRKKGHARAGKKTATAPTTITRPATASPNTRPLFMGFQPPSQ